MTTISYISKAWIVFLIRFFAGGQETCLQEISQSDQMLLLSDSTPMQLSITRDSTLRGQPYDFEFHFKNISKQYNLVF